jgi:hypothetical protein
MCKSDWNFDYHGINFLKEISWTDERALVHGSMVDRSGYPFRVLIWSVHFGFDGSEEGGRGNGGCGRHDWAKRRRGSPETDRNWAPVARGSPRVGRKQEGELGNSF